MMETSSEKTIGLTSDTHKKLQRLKEDGIFIEMLDGYRFGISLALYWSRPLDRHT